MSETLKEIFVSVRKEDVVLFAGSGLSRYAGYPLGHELNEMVFDSLSQAEKQDIDKGLTLADLAENIVRLRNSKIELHALLKEIFEKTPASLKYHQIIKNIPHIQTIITTNYDNLFEIAMGKDAKKLVKEEDLGLLNGEREIFKIHGDFSYPASVVLLTSDYTEFFKDQKINSLLWSNVKARLSNKTILFIGYDLEDPNVQILLSELSKALGTSKKSVFLVAPGLRKPKLNLLIQYGIKYIDSKGEIFIEKLYENIKEHIMKDFDNGLVSIKTLKTFFLNNNIQFDLDSAGDKSIVTNLRGIHGGMQADFQLKFNQKSDIKSKLTELLRGNSVKEVIIYPTHLDELKFTSKSIDLLGESKDYRIILGSLPNREGKADVRFEDGFEMTDIEYKIFVTSIKVVITCAYKNSTIEFIIAKADPSVGSVFNYNLKKNYERTTEAIKSLTFLSYLLRGVKCTVFTQDDKKFHQLPSPSFNDEKFLENINQNLEFYELLQKTELIYKINFTDLPDPSNDLYSKIKLATETPDEKINIVVWNEDLRFNLNAEDTPLALIANLEKPGATLQAFAQEPEIIEILGHTINLGYKTIIYHDLYITNLREIQKNTQHVAILKSKSGTVKIQYKKESIPSSPLKN